MSFPRDEMQIVIATKVYVRLEQPTSTSKQPAHEAIRKEIPVVWVLDDADFRLDINLPEPSLLDILFPVDVESLHVNGETIWGKALAQSANTTQTRVEMTSSGLRFTCTSGGALHILAHILSQE